MTVSCGVFPSGTSDSADSDLAILTFVELSQAALRWTFTGVGQRPVCPASKQAAVMSHDCVKPRTRRRLLPSNKRAS